MTKLPPFSDEAVIYFSAADDVWVSHSLRTDQIGTGRRIVDALADMIRAVQEVCAEATKDESLAYLREAPDEIKTLMGKSQKLPKETFEIAYKMVHGDWPDYLQLEETKQAKKASYKADLKEVVCA